MSKAAHIYAKASYQLAKESSQEEQVFGDMKLINSTLSSSKDLKLAISSPVIPVSKKDSILKEVFSDLNTFTANLIHTLLVNKRINLLGNVALAFIELYELNNNMQRASVVVSKEMTAELEKKIQDKVNEITGSHVEMKTTIDPSILGGFILTINDLQYDASVSGKLNKFKTQLVN